MRELEIGTKKHTVIHVVDDISHGANHCYLIRNSDFEDGLKFSVSIMFQKGPVSENILNGCHNEDLIAIVIDRLESFQKTEFRCRENALAITKLEETLHWLRHRTESRAARGVEGTSKI